MRWRLLAMRLPFALLMLFSSIYSLLMFVPFTYRELHLSNLFPGLTAFIQAQPLVYWITFLPLAAQMMGIRRPLVRWPLIALFSMAGFGLLWRPVLADLPNNAVSIGWGMAWLLPILCIAAVDWLEALPAIPWAATKPEEEHTLFHAAWLAALLVALIYSAVFHIHHVWTAGVKVDPRATAVAASQSVLTHLLGFMAIYATLHLITSISSLMPRPPRVQFCLSFLLGAVVVWLIVKRILFSALTVDHPAAELYAIVFALSVAAMVSGMCLRLYRPADGVVASGILFSLQMLSGVRRPGFYKALLAACALSVIAYGLAVNVALLDWNYMLQKIVVLLVWLGAFTIFYAMMPLPALGRRMTAVLLAVAAFSVISYKTALALQPVYWPPEKNNESFSRFLDRYAGYDASFKLLHEVVAPVKTDNRFYRFLARNTNIPRDVKVEPAEMKLAAEIKTAAGPKPNIFVLVVDSLRRDYVSAFNSDVEFTPNLGKFAAENIAFQNAFTHYGATGLSEPSIWAGGMLLHKQYVTPFQPMNALGRLVEANGYRMLVSRDEILATVTAGMNGLELLDRDRQAINYDMCSTLDEVEAKLGTHASDGRPVFVYTQSQNIHISTISREGGKPVNGRNYKRFFAPYASRMERIDGCIGKFIQYLKTSNQYDNSIVIFTADHGDSLGEEGRWGHAYTLFPEIARVPLIVHLPAEMRKRYAANEKAIAFSTDITPSLYYLLGNRPIANNEIFGRPLFTESLDEQKPYMRKNYVLASSYAAVYGTLNADGTEFFLSDAVNSKDHFFDLSSGLNGRRARLTGAMRVDSEKLIRAQIDRLNAFYKFTN